MIDLVGKKVKHAGVLKSFGVGEVISQSENSIKIKFASTTSEFPYPAAFEKSLSIDDPAIAQAIAAEIKALHEAEEAKRADEAARKLAEEKAKQEALMAKAQSSGKAGKSRKEYKPIKRVDGQALIYLVFQGATFLEESTGEYIWAPLYAQNGTTMHHWDRLLDLRAGDVIFHCADGYIQALSQAKGPCENSARPSNSEDWKNWEKNGRRVDCDYYFLKQPLKHGEYKDTIIQYCNVKYAPFDKDGNGNLGYLYPLDQDLAKFFLEEIIKANPDVKDLDFLQFLLH